MDNYYKPDDRWKMFGITKKELFEQQFVVKGCFHKGVPKDVKDAFITVEHLMAYAYYYWFLYDEAFNKALRLLEMAIKQKAKLKGIPLNNKSFDILINEICSESNNEQLKNSLHRARKIRNKQVHADSNSSSGLIGGKDRNIKLFVNLLNELFLDDSWQMAQFEKQELNGEQLLSFQNSLLVFENNVPGILVSGILDFKILDETLFLVLNPVLRNTKHSLEEHRYSNPISIALSNFKFQGECLTGTSKDGYEIKIYKTDKAENVVQFEKHNNGLNSVNETDREFYKSYIMNESAWNIVELEYNYLSKNLN